MPSPNPAPHTRVDRRTLLLGLTAGAAAPAALAACSAPSSATASASAPPAKLAATPSAPVTLNILDVAGNLQLTKGMIEAFKSGHPEIVSSVTYSIGSAPQLASKIQAQQQAGNVQIHLVLTGTDGLAAGIQNQLWTDVKPYYAQYFPTLMTDYQAPAAAMAKLAQDQGVELVWYPSGPLIEYNPAVLATPPGTVTDLLAWAKANPGRFQYAQPANSGPGRTFLMGLPYLLGDSDPKDPVDGWTKTWAYLKELGQYVAAYPSGTTVTMKNLAAGTVGAIASTTGWYINPRALGTVPAAMRVAKLDGFHWVTDAQYGVIPKGVSDDVMIANLRLLQFMLKPAQQALAYDTGYFYPGPAVKGVTPAMAPAASRQTIAQYGDPDFDTWIGRYPMETSLPAPDQVKAFEIWDKQIGAAK